MQDNAVVTIVALLVLCVLEICALYYKVNGQVFATVIAAVCGLAGYAIKTALPDGVVTKIKEKISI